MIDRSTLDGRRGPPAQPGSFPPPMTTVCSLLSAARRPPHSRVSPSGLQQSRPRGDEPLLYHAAPGRSLDALRRPALPSCPYRPQSTPDGTLWLLGANTIAVSIATAAHCACPGPMAARVPLLHFPHATAAPEFAPLLVKCFTATHSQGRQSNAAMGTVKVLPAV